MRVVSCAKKMQGVWLINQIKCFAKRAGCIGTKSICKDGEPITKLELDLCKILNVKNVSIDCGGLLHPQPTPAPTTTTNCFKICWKVFYLFTYGSKNENKSELELQCDFENVSCDCNWYDYDLCNGPCCPSQQPPRPIVLLFIEIIFGMLLEYEFKYDLYEILNENKNELELESKCDFKNANCEIGFDIGGEWLPATPTPTPCPRVTLFNFTNSRVESHQQLVLTGDICDRNNIVSENVNENNNKNFDDNEYDYGVLLLPGPTDIPRPATGDFNAINTDIFKDVFRFIYVQVIL